MVRLSWNRPCHNLVLFLTAWSECTTTCVGGQRYRQRELKPPNVQGGACPLLTLKAVGNAQPCEQEITDCVC